MKKIQKILSGAKERERSDRNNTGQNLGPGLSWSETPNVSPPAVPGPSSVQPRGPFHDNQALGTFPSAMMRALPVLNTAAQISTGPNNAPSFPQQPQQFEIPSESGIQTAPSHQKGSFFCRWCDRCKFGIPFDKDSYICMKCNYWLCRGCRNVHTTLHPQRIKVEMHQWINLSNEYAPVSTCSQCSTVQRARLQCKSNNCSHSLCLACFHVGIYLDKFLKDCVEKEPTHQEFLAIYPDEWDVTETRRNVECMCYGEEPVRRHPAWVLHCEKCHDRINIGSCVYWCRDCRQNWGNIQWICQQCFCETAERNMQHKPKHYFIKALIREEPDLPDTHSERLYCPTCGQWLKEVDYPSHKHDTDSYAGTMSIQRDPDLYFVVSPRQKDWLRINMYRNCDKELVARKSVQYPDEIGGTEISKCRMCQFLLAYNQPATLCIKSGCGHCIYCASCTNSKRIDHRHKDSTYVVKLIRKTNRVLDLLSPIQCAKCRKQWLRTHFIGLFCNHCKHFAICWRCIGAASKGPSFELPPGLPHEAAAGSNRVCTASDWLLVYEPAQGIIRA